MRPQRPTAAPVHVTPRGDRLEVRLARVLARDIAVLKSIPGRQWDHVRRVWSIPDCAASRERLGRAFGDRLIELTEGASGSGAAEADSSRSRQPGEAASPPKEPGSAEATPLREADTEDANSRSQLRAAEAASDRLGGAGSPEHAPAPIGPRFHAGVDDLIARIRTTMRTREYSPKTERAYVGWVKRFYGFADQEPSRRAAHDVGTAEAMAFLEHLAKQERLAPKSRNQAASALSFLFREVLGRDELAEVPRAKGSRRVPTVLSHREVIRVVEELRGKYRLTVLLLYSAGLRIEECLRIRVKDVDFELRQILVRDGKGRKDRFVPLAERVCDPLRRQIRRVESLYERSREEGGGWAPLPGALHRKDPKAGYELAWQFVFPARKLSTDPGTGRPCRAPLHATAVQRAVKAAVRSSGIQKRATCHTFRHSFATELLRSGCDVRTLQQLMGHKDIRTTMIYLHAVEQTGLGIRSPLDRTPDEVTGPNEWIAGPDPASADPNENPGLPWD